MAFIVQRLTEQRLQLGREDLLRPVTFGSNWNVIRIAALIQVNLASLLRQPTSAPLISLGMATGPSGILGSTTSAIGAGPGSWTAWDWAFQTSGGAYYLTSAAPGATTFQKVGSVFTTSYNSGSTALLPALPVPGSSAIQRAPIIVDIARGTYVTGNPTPITVDLWLPTTAAGILDLNLATFYERIQGLTTITNMTRLVGLSFSATQPLTQDHAFLSWSYATPTLEVCAFTVIRFA
jgi:hypothetical protein